MLRVILSVACSFTIGIFLAFCFIGYTEFAYGYFPNSDYIANIIFVISSAALFFVFYNKIFKNVPTLKNALMKVSADTKDVINAKNKGKR